MHTSQLEPHDDRVSVLLELGLEKLRPPGIEESERVDRNTFQVVRVRPAMGTIVSVTALDSSRAVAEDGIEAAFREMSRLVAIIDRHDAATPLAQLNAAGRLREAPPELLEVAAASQDYHRLTRGAFDPTVMPLVELLRASGGRPGPAEWREAEELVGAEKLRLRRRDVSFDRSGMGLTLDGIGKGYIVDRMAGALSRRGISRFLINAGGDIRVAGGKQDGQPWTIGVQDPEDRRGLIDVVSLGDGAVATSGNYEKAAAHIVDLNAGTPARRCLSVSVLARGAMAADALATAMFVLGPRAGCHLAASVRDCECLVVDETAKPSRSPGWRGHVSGDWVPRGIAPKGGEA